MEYRMNLGLSPKYRFGVELECTGIYLDVLDKIFKEHDLPVKYVLDHKNRYASYNVWYLDYDNTVSVSRGKRYYNGELSSRIMTDRKECWEELRQICQVLRDYGVGVNDRCSNHITVGLSYLQDEKYFFEVLSKLLILYENELVFFYMGENYGIRKTMDSYARRVGINLLDKIDLFDFSDMNFLYRFIEMYPTVFGKHCAINLRKYVREELMEIRYPNGTIDCGTIQNNVNFSLKLVDAIDRRIIDLDELSWKIDSNREEVMTKLKSGETREEDFAWLVSKIAENSLDRDGFMKQYRRVVKSKKNGVV